MTARSWELIAAKESRGREAKKAHSLFPSMRGKSKKEKRGGKGVRKRYIRCQGPSLFAGGEGKSLIYRVVQRERYIASRGKTAAVGPGGNATRSSKEDCLKGQSNLLRGG